MLGLTAGTAAEHGQRLEHHFVEEQSHRFVVQMVLQQEAVIVHVPPLTRDGHTLTQTQHDTAVSTLSVGALTSSTLLDQSAK